MAYYLHQLGLQADRDQEAEILDRVKARGMEKKALLTMEEFRTIVEQVL